jgi:hypothetical protein
MFSYPAPGGSPDRRIKVQIGCLFPKLPNCEPGALSNEEDYMPAIASLDDLKAAQQALLKPDIFKTLGNVPIPHGRFPRRQINGTTY